MAAINFSVTYPKADTANQSVNEKELTSEIIGSDIENFSHLKSVSGDSIQYTFKVDPDPATLTMLENIIAAHTGRESDISLNKKNARDQFICDVGYAAILKGRQYIASSDPTLQAIGAGLVAGTMAYHSYRGSEIYTWVQFGESARSQLVAKITEDRQAGQPFHALLESVVNPRGDKFADYFILGTEGL